MWGELRWDEMQRDYRRCQAVVISHVQQVHLWHMKCETLSNCFEITLERGNPHNNLSGGDLYIVQGDDSMASLIHGLIPWAHVMRTCHEHVSWSLMYHRDTFLANIPLAILWEVDTISKRSVCMYVHIKIDFLFWKLIDLFIEWIAKFEPSEVSRLTLFCFYVFLCCVMTWNKKLKYCYYRWIDPVHDWSKYSDSTYSIQLNLKQGIENCSGEAICSMSLYSTLHQQTNVVTILKCLESMFSQSTVPLYDYFIQRN